ncbi:MFS transporter [Lysinibacillus sp. NPDC097214]|uniref:MFS transporter n=1 Tax=Lysinibacillus sp. NPDC097214 TaxID=3390584 RepID=UPI003D013FBF
MRLNIINKDFSSMWLSNLLSILNGRFRELVIPLMVLGLTNSPLVTGLVALSQQLGTVLLAIPIGTWVEKKNKVRVARICHLIYGIGIFTLAYLITLEQLNVAVIPFVLFFMGIVSLISGTAFSTMIPSVAGRKKLLEAHTSLEAADAIVTLIGPAIGGFLLAKTGSFITLSICATFSLLSALFISLVRNREIQPQQSIEMATKEKKANFFRQTVDGLKYLIVNTQQLINTIVLSTLGFSTVFIVLTVLLHARISLNFSEELIGILLSSAGIGNIIGVLIMKWFKNRNWLLLLCSLLIISSFGVFVIFSTENFILMCLGMIIFDGALSMAFVVQVSVHQGITPNNYLARVKSATYVIGGLSTMLGTFLAGAIPEFSSSRIALGIGVFVLAIPALYLLKFRKLGVKLSKIKTISMNSNVE